MDSLLAVNELPRIKGDRRAKFEKALAAPVLFDYYGLERGGHNAVMRWILSCGEQPHMAITWASTKRPGNLFYHPNNWFTSALPDPKSVAVVYGPDRDLSITQSRSTKPKVIVCVRDVRNLFASRLKWNDLQDRMLFRVDGLGIYSWLQHARQVLGDVDYFNERAYGICYDKWFASEEYRKQILVDLNTKFDWKLEYNTQLLNEVCMLAEGSSFDKAAFQGRAQKMKVLDRWKTYKNHYLMKKLLTPDILTLNDRLLQEI